MLKKEVVEPHSSLPDESNGHSDSIALPEEVATDSGLGGEAKQTSASEASGAVPLDSKADIDQLNKEDAGNYDEQENGALAIGSGLEEPLLEQSEVRLSLC